MFKLYHCLFTGRIGLREFWFGLLLLTFFVFPFSSVSPLYPWTGGHEYGKFFFGIFIAIWVVSLNKRRINDLEGVSWVYGKTPFRKAQSLLLLCVPTNLKKNAFGSPMNRKKNIFSRTFGL